MILFAAVGRGNRNPIYRFAAAMKSEDSYVKAPVAPEALTKQVGEVGFGELAPNPGEKAEPCY